MTSLIDPLVPRCGTLLAFQNECVFVCTVAVRVRGSVSGFLRVCVFVCVWVCVCVYMYVCVCVCVSVLCVSVCVCVGCRGTVQEHAV